MQKKSKMGTKAKSQARHVAAALAEEPESSVHFPSSILQHDAERSTLKTSSESLQSKLDLLVALAAANDRVGFVNSFVPLDLTADDTAGYLQDLTDGPEAEGQWQNLIAEIRAISVGVGVNRIGGDQVKVACFFFAHPTLDGCDREVVFTCSAGEWRAEG
jgi:hypothetical protein